MLARFQALNLAFLLCCNLLGLSPLPCEELGYHVGVRASASQKIVFDSPSPLLLALVHRFVHLKPHESGQELFGFRKGSSIVSASLIGVDLLGIGGAHSRVGS